METPEDKRPTVEEILAHQSYPDTIWRLVPTQSGKLPVAKGRGGPFNIDWEVHGSGDIKVVWIVGLGSIKSTWQRQTLYFGHEHGDKYSCLIFDNRGMGGSDTPFLRYSTSEMAKDCLELLEHLGWAKDRNIHVIGVSMGGMIAQELAYANPNIISTLTLLSTAALIENTTTFFENLLTRLQMFIPKPLSRSVLDASLSLFPSAWLSLPDTTPLPLPSTPNVLPPATHPFPYLRFRTNYERFAATELTKRLDPTVFKRTGFLLQAVAAGWHYKSFGQLRELADGVGRGRILVIHGTVDRLISFPHGEKLVAGLGLGGQEWAGRWEVREGVGHAVPIQEEEWFTERMERLWGEWEGKK